MGFKSLQLSVQQILFLIDNVEIQLFSTCYIRRSIYYSIERNFSLLL